LCSIKEEVVGNNCPISGNVLYTVPKAFSIIEELQA
jgi:hypothetical protein